MNLRLPSLPRRWRRSWTEALGARIGIDIGTHSIKCVQLRRLDGQWRLGTFRVLTLEQAVADTQDHGTVMNRVQQALCGAPDLRKLFRGRRASCALPMSLVQQRSLQIPPATPDEMNDLIREELAGSGEDDSCEFGWWPTDAAETGSQDAGARVMVVSTPTRLAKEVAACLNGAGFDCDLLDAMPTVLSRSAWLAEGERECGPIGMLDLGYCSPLMVFVVDGKPVFSRQLASCGLRHLLAPVCSALGVSQPQCGLLFRRYGVASQDEPQSELAAAIHQSAIPYLENLVAQLDRTLSYVQQHYRLDFSGRIWLTGGGGVLPGLDRWLAGQLNHDVRRWSLVAEGGLRDGDPSPLLAAAAALSLIGQVT